jgi:hypothetical protein
MNGSNLISVRGGVIFKINLQNQTAVVLRTSTSDRISINHRRVDLQLSGKGMVIFDPGNMPVLMEGNNVKRSVWTTVEENGAITKGVPQSNMGVFVQSRLWVDISGTDFTAGDFVGDVNNPDANFTFDEVFTEGAPYVDQIFNLGYGFGNYRITAMGFVASRNGNSRLQVSQYGSLYVATRNSVHIYSAELPRAQWATTDFGRLELYGTGIVGQRAHSIIGSDILFQDINGYVHSLSKNQSDARQGWVTTRISREVEDWLKPVSKSYLDVGFITPYNTRIYVGAKPIRVKTPNYLGGVSYDFCHEGMVVLELDNASSMSGAAAPAWAGMWTGIRPMEATEIDGALYITSRDIDGFARTYRVREDVSFDTWNGYR